MPLAATEAVYALIGIVIGGVLSGGMQLFIAWRERVQSGRAAARVVFADLNGAAQAFHEGVEARGWWRVPISLEGWNEYRLALAASMDPQDFHQVGGVFHVIGGYEKLRAAGTREGEVLDTDALASNLRDDLREKLFPALLTLAKAGMSHRQWAHLPEADGSGGDAGAFLKEMEAAFDPPPVKPPT